MRRQHLMTIWLFKRRRVPCMKGHEPAVTHAGMAYITHTYKKAPLLQEVTSAEWNAWRQRAEAGQDRTLEIQEREPPMSENSTEWQEEAGFPDWCSPVLLMLLWNFKEEGNRGWGNKFFLLLFYLCLLLGKLSGIQEYRSQSPTHSHSPMNLSANTQSVCATITFIDQESFWLWMFSYSHVKKQYY